MNHSFWTSPLILGSGSTALKLPSLETMGGVVLQILLMFIGARIFIRVLTRLIRRLFRLSGGKIETRKRATMEELTDNVIRYTVYFIYGIMVIDTLGIKISGLLAGAGIVGVALGFGAQSLIKDVLTGFFILFEDQYGVGDTVKINGFTGTVISIGLRLTRIQAWTGEVEIIPNGQVQQVTNYSRHNSIAVVDVSVSYGADLELAVELMRKVMDGLQSENENIVGEVSILGVQTMRTTDVVLRATAECRPGQNFGVQRVAQQRIKRAFDEADIPFPSAQSLLGWNGDSVQGPQKSS